MVRVFLLAVLSLIALMLVARALPPPGGAPMVAGGPEDQLDPSAPFAAWDGTWEGTLNAYRPDGSLESSERVRREMAAVSPAEQTLTTIRREAGGRETRERGRQSAADGRLERRLWNEDGTSHLLAGRRLGRAILWHRRDERTGLEETFREEVLRTASGELYTVDGWGSYPRQAGADPVHVMYEGRFRRPERDEE